MNVEKITYMDHFWCDHDADSDWKKAALTPVYLTSIGVVVAEDDVHVALCSDWGDKDERVDSHVRITTILKSAIISRRICAIDATGP